MAREMTPDERREFLLEGTRTGKVATTRGDGRRVATAVGGRYMGADRADEFGARNAVPGELVVRITPTHIVARADIAD